MFCFHRVKVNMTYFVLNNPRVELLCFHSVDGWELDLYRHSYADRIRQRMTTATQASRETQSRLNRMHPFSPLHQFT